MFILRFLRFQAFINSFSRFRALMRSASDKSMNFSAKDQISKKHLKIDK